MEIFLGVKKESKRMCLICDKSLTSIGSDRKNGGKTNDWESRYMHKNCYKGTLRLLNVSNVKSGEKKMVRRFVKIMLMYKIIGEHEKRMYGKVSESLNNRLNAEWDIVIMAKGNDMRIMRIVSTKTKEVYQLMREKKDKWLEGKLEMYKNA